MTVFVYDKKLGKVVPEHERTDRGEKPAGVYVAKQFTGKGIRNAQLARSPWDNSEACHYRSFKELEQKAAAQGMVVNRTSERHAHQE